jgi:hypothetical protein
MQGEDVQNSGELETICNALLAVRQTLESHLAHNDSWRALRTVELGSIVAQHLGSDASEDSKKLHRKLLRTSATYRAYTRLIEAIRILSEASAEFDLAIGLAPATDDSGPQHRITVVAQDRPNADGKPRIRVRAASRLVSDVSPAEIAKVRAA